MAPDHSPAPAGACERIFRTPIPVVYTRHTSRFLTIWGMLVPFCLWHAPSAAPLRCRPPFVLS